MLTRKHVALVVLLAVLSWDAVAGASETVLVYPASSCVQTYGRLGDFLGPMGDGPPRGYEVEGNGLFQGDIVDDINGPPPNPLPIISDNTVTVYCPLELNDTTTVINQVEVFTNDNGFVPPEFLPTGTPPTPFVSCTVHVSTIDGCQGPLIGNCSTDPNFETQANIPLFSGPETLEFSADAIPIPSWPTGGWSYAVLSCDLLFGRGIFSYRVDQQ
jgi:hypothetical protein